jgi:predicted site-specific integrase-resolvase
MNAPYVTLEQAAKHFSVSLSTFRSWVRTGAVPESSYLRQASVYRFDLAAVEHALRNNADAKNETTGDKE